MSRWLSDKYNLAIILLIAAVGLLYADSFSSPFFQDDKLLLELSGNANPLAPIANFPYRPVSINFFYGFSRLLFGPNPAGFHLLEFLFFAGSLFCVFHLAARLTGNRGKGLLSAVFYALNISLFSEFYWIATSYFSLGSFFLFAAVLAFISRSKTSLLISFLLYILALGSNEIALVLPPLLTLMSALKNISLKRVLPFWISAAAYFFWRLFFVGLPQATAYHLEFNGQFLSTFKWYFFRVLNLPEGVDRAHDPVILVAFAALLMLLLVSLLKYLKSGRVNGRLMVIGLSWFFLGALPFFFLPGHASSYYLSFALFGPSLLVADILSGKLVISLFLAAYLTLSVRGLDFLRHSHWQILKNTGPVGQFTNL